MSDADGTEVRIGPPIIPDYLRSAYANQVNVTFTPHDFRLTFSVLEAPLLLPDSGEVNPNAVASVLVPATVMYAFIGVMREQFDRYLAQYGVPGGVNPEGPGSGIEGNS